MRDFPIFTTEFGVSSLFLKEIPYRGEAYIQIQDVQEGFAREHLAECAAFCRSAGAEHIFATGKEVPEDFPLHAAILQMRGTAWVDPDRLEQLFPVTEATVGRWREIYNEKLRAVDCAATLTAAEETQILSSGGAYFVHHEGQLLGIGWLEDPQLRTVAAVQPGAGERVMHTLMSLMEGADMTLEVASTNHRAIRLYEKLGLLTVGETKRWYRIL